MPASSPVASILLIGLSCASTWGAEPAIPVHIDAIDAACPQAVAGGIPFPRGVLRDPADLSVATHDGVLLPCQVTRLASWPDGSVEWALVESVVGTGTPGPAASSLLQLQHGPRAPITHPLRVQEAQGWVTIDDGAGVHARIGGTGRGNAVMTELRLGGEDIISPAHPAVLELHAARVPQPGVLAPDDAWFHGPGIQAGTAALRIRSVAVEDAGPLHVVVCLRGVFEVPHWGEGLPAVATRDDPVGQIPFSLRIGLNGAAGTVTFTHQIVFTGEPDRDFITQWGIRLPGLAHGSRVCVDPAGGSTPDARLVWAPVHSGVGVVEDGWQSRPTGIVDDGHDAVLACWPQAAGPMDLRRYARTWAAGESGNTRDVAAMERFSHLAARGMALSRRFVLHPVAVPNPAASARSLSRPALLVADPAWYGASVTCGDWAAPGPDGSGLESMIERRLDYHLFCQDLFGWYGALVYGYWQTRYGQAHRIDRWDNDYGRWGWDLGDGGGRIGQLLLQEFLRTGVRRYFDAGAAYSRICFDTAMVHTRMHLENAGGWWVAQGLSHRHNVQPYGCPYLGLRGSYPGGQRLLYFLTGDGTIRDGLDLVADAAADAAAGRLQRLGDSGDGDGQGAAAMALLWRAETTNAPQDAEACRKIIEGTHVLPPAKPQAVGYTAAFGLYEAATMLADRTQDQDLRARLVQSARVIAHDTESTGTLQLLARAVQWTRDPMLSTALHQAVAAIQAHAQDGMEDQPRAAWPGHAGWRTPVMDANQLRALPWALAALTPQTALGRTSAPTVPPPPSLPLPATPPASWYHPGGGDPVVPPSVAALQQAAQRPATAGPMQQATGPITWRCDAAGPVAVAAAFASRPLTCWAMVIDDAQTPSCHPVVATDWRVAGGGAGLVLTSTTTDLRWILQMQADRSEGVPVVRIDVALRTTAAVAGWGIDVPCAVGADAHQRLVTMPGRFRLERCRMDQNDERLPNWLTAEYHWGEGAPLWPLWRHCGIDLGPDGAYRIWRTSGDDTAPVTCDQGSDGAAWLDWTDRSLATPAGCSVRIVPSVPSSAALQADLATGTIHVMAQRFAPGRSAPAHDVMVSTLLLAPHDGYRPPFSRPDLTRTQYDALIKDLSYGENQGLAALRFARAITHKVPGTHWLADLRDLGIEPHEILAQMQWGDGLATFCRRLGVRWDPSDVAGSITRILDHYRTPAGH